MPKEFIFYHTNLYTDSDAPYLPVSDEQPKAPGEAKKVQKAIQDSRDMYTLPQKGKGKKEVGVDSSDGIVEGGGVVANTMEPTPTTIRVKGHLYKLALQKMLPPAKRPAVEPQTPELKVVYLWVVNVVSGESMQLYMQILQPNDNTAVVMEELADFAEAEWDDDYAIGKVGIARPADILKGEELQDALDQLGQTGHAEISTITPRGRQIPKRVLVPSRAEVAAETIRVKGQLYRLPPEDPSL